MTSRQERAVRRKRIADDFAAYLASDTELSFTEWQQERGRTTKPVSLPGGFAVAFLCWVAFGCAIGSLIALGILAWMGKLG